MICKNCSRNSEDDGIEEEDFNKETSLCFGCEKAILAKERLKKFVELFIDNDFSIETSLEFEESVLRFSDYNLIMSFNHKGRITFLDKEGNELK